jgi:hypothetical protein
MAMTKTYEVGVWKEEGGFIKVEARDKREAVAKVREMIYGSGLLDWDKVRRTHADCHELNDVSEVIDGRTCRCCECTNKKECEGGCEWSTIDPTLCTNCERCPEAS